MNGKRLLLLFAIAFLVVFAPYIVGKIVGSVTLLVILLGILLFYTVLPIAVLYLMVRFIKWSWKH